MSLKIKAFFINLHTAVHRLGKLFQNGSKLVRPSHWYDSENLLKLRGRTNFVPSKMYEGHL